MGDGSYKHASADFINTFQKPVGGGGREKGKRGVKGGVQHVYKEALRPVFLTDVAFGDATTRFSFPEKEVRLRKELETEYGLMDRDPSRKEAIGNAVAEKNS
ncbi:hypothetical protein F4779DRAFT_83843 [Xylariaceae sp. FL0662B]|nr:hypothetical protein F4779DRAFT_83843 [Xylariaceae sp. FL0662B]